MSAVETRAEARETFPCFGSTCSVLVGGRGPAGGAGDAVRAVRRRLEQSHRQLSRFDSASELSRLNRDTRRTVPVSPIVARLAEAVRGVGALTGGLVDGTLVGEIERVGYDADLTSPPVPLAEALSMAPSRRPGGPSASAGWRAIEVDRAAGTVTRPPGVWLDSGGIAKGMLADVLAPVLARHASFALDCGGDLRVGGTAGLAREVHAASPFDGSILHTFELADGAVATSGIGKRSWRDASGRLAHHLLDPATGEPAFTGVVQVTAIAPTGVLAEALSKAAILAGPDEADAWLANGGVVVFDDGSYRVVERPIGR